jgi:hypothetical protein
MAGELKGDFFEAVVELALKQSGLPAAFAKLEYRAHTTPPGFQKELDFYWANGLGNPEVIVMVTHTDSQKDWSRKFWRNAGELIEAKHRTLDRCYVVSVVFDSETKSGLELLADEIMDSVIVLSASLFPNLAKVGRECSNFITKGDSFAEKCRSVAGIREIKIEISALSKALANSLATRVSKTKGLASTIDQIAAKRKPEVSRPLQIPNLRKIFGRLACCDDSLIIEVLDNSRKPSHSYKNDIDFGLAVGVYQKSIGKRLSIEASSALSSLDKDVAGAVMRAFDPILRVRFRKELEQALNLNADQVNAFNKIVQFGVSSALVTSLLVDDFNKPGALCSGSGYSSPWFFSFFLDFAKAFYEKKNDYGYGWLTRNRAASPKIRFWAPKYVSSAECIPNEELPALALFMTTQILDWASQPAKFKDACERVKEYRVNNILVNKIDCHVGDPMDFLVEVFLNKHGISVSRRPVYTFLNDLAGEYSAGFLTGFVVGKTLIFCRSVTEGGRDHKVRELCGFIRATYLSSKNRVLKKNPDIEKRFLVIDGDFRQSDLDILRESGFDRFFSAHEMEQLGHQLV